MKWGSAINLAEPNVSPVKAAGKIRRDELTAGRGAPRILGVDDASAAPTTGCGGVPR